MMTRFITPHSMWRKRWNFTPLASLVVLSLLICRAEQLSFAGYQDITLTSVPKPLYTVNSRITEMPCTASGHLIATGANVSLDVVFFRNESPLLNKYNTPARHHYMTDDGVTVTGLIISPTTLEDNGVLFKCQVFINNQLVNVSSPQVSLIVADGRPPAIPLQVSSVTVQSVTLQWSAPLLPSDGPVLHYTGYLYDDDGSTVLSVFNISGNSSSATYSGLLPDRQYRVTVVAVNDYGNGNVSTPISFRTSQSSQAPAPTALSFTLLAGNGNLEIGWDKPVINSYDTTYPITHYIVQHKLYSSPSFITENTPDNSTLSFRLQSLTIGSVYVFKVTPFNYGSGTPNSIEKTFTMTEPNTIASSTATPHTTPTTTSSLTTSSVAPSSTHSTTSTGSIIIASSESTTTHTSKVSSQATPTSTTPATTLASHSTSSYTSSFINSVSATRSSSSTLSPSVEATTDSYSGGSDDFSNKAIVLASAVIASIILIAIVIIAVILVGFCFYTNRRKHGDVNLSVAATWPERRPSNIKRSGSKDSSIKGSSLSGSISHSLSSDQDLPSIHMNGPLSHTSSSNVPSDSPSSHKTDTDLRSIEELSEDEIDEKPVTTEV
ncbi:PREDICTED: flocculation protein FLO11-like isoform X1 [Amphimedon queenslandica]|uniref:Fibronectin type-III domain-containing protein n=1 Tax=Amphimedon queenslandica TaxID=400682 RepID=A0A1X7UJ93_AMPQE|nr:PREDICTED: flocculation protein FLO11-like isoform X1 [Amphimedon queenslandica]|eukprot:XP_019853934.1 PREDICTED: flocculation protein FLO11-like isoform X1 [Amphimedon queenslandica]